MNRLRFWKKDENESIPESSELRRIRNVLLSDLTDDELKSLAYRQASMTTPAGLAHIREEMRYREQTKISTWVTVLVGGTLIANFLALGIRQC